MKLAFLTLLTLSTACAAHDFWLEPSDAEIGVGQPVGIFLKLGDSFENAMDVPRSVAHLAQFRIWHEDGSSEDIVGLENESPAGVCRIDEAGTYVVAYLSKPTKVQLDGVTFEKYLLHEGFTDLIKERHAKGKASESASDTFVRCGKLAVQAGNGSFVVSQAIGLPFEIVPLSPPDAEGGMEVSVLYQKKPASDILVSARKRGGVGELSVRTNAEGRAVLKGLDPGFWVLRCVMIESSHSDDATVRSYWASYSFMK